MEKYSFVQKLGQGAYAVVWKARRKSDGRLVALKQFKQSPESWEACKQLPEVRSAAAIQDRRHVVVMLEAVRHGGELFLVFEHMESSLHACTALGQRIEEPQVRWASRRLLAALAAVHAAGLVHCDVKPENILVGMDPGDPGLAGALKLCDFGQAAPPESMGTYVGTRWYRAPELLLGARGDQAVDIWAAGCTLAELLLRRPLFPGSDLRDMLFKICGELGAPDPDEVEAWPLASKFIEASRRTNAPAVAWSSLARAGASEGGVNLLSALLRYNPSRRLRPDKALKEAPFFAPGAVEVAIPLAPARPQSPGTMQRHRDEATAVEKRIGKAAPPAEAGAAAGSAGPLAGDSADEGYARQGRGVAGDWRTAGASSGSFLQEGVVSRAAPRHARSGIAAQAWQGSPRREAHAPSAPTWLPTGAARLGPPAGGGSGSGSARSAPHRAEHRAESGSPLYGRDSPERSGSPGNSDDEALAEAFWGAVKAGGGGSSVVGALEDKDAEEEEALASKIVADMAERGRARRVRPPDAGGRPTRSGA